MIGRHVRGALAIVPLLVACGTIEGAPLSTAPLNAGCPEVNACDAYDVKGAKTKPQCNDGRCDFGRPDFLFTVVVNVPDSSFYAPARTFVLASTDLSAQTGVPVRGPCVPPTCVQLPALVPTQGKYRVTAAAAAAVGLPLTENTSIPIRVAFVPLLENQKEALREGVPLDPVLTSSRVNRRTDEILYIDTISLGRYLRIAYPQPPYDEFFPPVMNMVRITEPGAVFVDDFLVGDTNTPLDDEAGDSRRATVTRAEGLDGWHVWLADSATSRRISSIRTLSGTMKQVRLDTIGQRQESSRALRDGVDVIVAPPEGVLAVPRLQSRLLNGAGLEALVVPPLPAPAAIHGVVASGEGTALIGIPARLLFTSSMSGLRLANGTLQPLLHYTTAVSTDDRGTFATVLPPGVYDVTIEPAEGTGFAKVKETFDTADALARTYRPPPRTVAFGRVKLADGRPLAEAELLAIPSDTAGTAVKPRPARTRTDREGAFRFEVDQGQFDLVVEPQAGTGFPRVVQVRSFPTGTADLGEIVVAPPARVSFVLRDPSLNGNPIVRAMVRVFAEPPNRGTPAVEIGRAMTDENGKCEILLAQQAR